MLRARDFNLKKKRLQARFAPLSSTKERIFIELMKKERIFIELMAGKAENLNPEPETRNPKRYEPCLRAVRALPSRLIFLAVA